MRFREVAKNTKVREVVVGNYKRDSNKELADRLTRTCGYLEYKFTEARVKHLLGHYNLKRPVIYKDEKVRSIIFSNYDTEGNKELAARLNRECKHLDYIFTPGNVSELLPRLKVKRTPAQKSSILKVSAKRGGRPRSKIIKTGSKRFCIDENTGKRISAARFYFEKFFYPVPKGCIAICKDGDEDNLTKGNLILVERKSYLRGQEQKRKRAYYRALKEKSKAKKERANHILDSLRNLETEYERYLLGEYDEVLTAVEIVLAEGEIDEKIQKLKRSFFSMPETYKPPALQGAKIFDESSVLSFFRKE